MPKTLHINSLAVAEYQRTRYHCDVDPDVTIDDLLQPGFWAHHAARLKRGDILEVTNPDLTLDVELRVHGVDVGLVNVTVRFDASLLADADEDGEGDDAGDGDDEGPQLPDGYRVHFNPRATGQKYRALWKGVTPHLEIATGDTAAEVIEAAIEHDNKARGA